MTEIRPSFEDVHRARVARFRVFLRSGGSFSFAEWRALAMEDLDALAEAGASVEAERAVLVAEAILDAKARRAAPVSRAPDPLEVAGRLALARVRGGA